MPVTGLVPSIARGCSSLAFAASLSTFARCRVDPQGLSRTRAPRACSLERLGGVPRDLRLSFRAPDPIRGALPRGCPLGVHLPLVGFTRWCPLLRYASFTSTPGGVAAAVGPPDADPEDSFRPRGFAPPRRLSPRMSSGLIASRYRKGFAAFPRPSTTLPLPEGRSRLINLVGDGSLAGRPFPRLRLHTPRRSPPVSSRATLLWSLPPRRRASELDTVAGDLFGDPRPRGFAPLSGP